MDPITGEKKEKKKKTKQKIWQSFRNNDQNELLILEISLVGSNVHWNIQERALINCPR